MGYRVGAFDELFNIHAYEVKPRIFAVVNKPELKVLSEKDEVSLVRGTRIRVSPLLFIKSL